MGSIPHHFRHPACAKGYRRLRGVLGGVAGVSVVACVLAPMVAPRVAGRVWATGLALLVLAGVGYVWSERRRRALYRRAREAGWMLCHRCLYDLRAGREPETAGGVCPECGEFNLYSALPWMWKRWKKGLPAHPPEQGDGGVGGGCGFTGWDGGGLGM